MNKEIVLDRLREKLEKIKARDIMTASVITTMEDVSLSEAAISMLKSKISGMPVVNSSGDVIGVVTITDLFIAMAQIKYETGYQNEQGHYIEPSVGAVMTGGVITVSEDEDLSNIADLMINRGIHTLPITRDGRLIGVVGRRDVIRYFYSALAEVVNT